MNENDLSDIQLDGIELVSDNPADWIVPKQAANWDNLFDWWQSIIDCDGEEMPYSQDQIHEITDFVYEYEALKKYGLSDDKNNLTYLAEVRACVRGLLGFGLSFSQVAIMLSSTTEAVMREAYSNAGLSDDEVIQRLMAEQMLRAQQHTTPEITHATGLSESSVDTLAAIIKVKPQPMVVCNRPKPAHIREYAIQQRAEGKTNREISASIREIYNEVVPPATVSQWWRRKGE